jgi:hypothetical protein
VAPTESWGAWGIAGSGGVHSESGAPDFHGPTARGGRAAGVPTGKRVDSNSFLPSTVLSLFKDLTLTQQVQNLGAYVHVHCYCKVQGHNACFGLQEVQCNLQYIFTVSDS